MGEGYHNFHHQFPMDYRNAFYWYQYDPTKWFIAACSMLGFASQLRVFPENEIKKGVYTMKLKELKGLQDSLDWPSRPEALPILTWEQCELLLLPFLASGMLTWAQVQRESQDRTLLLVSGYIHDATSFVDQHPGGRGLIKQNSGKDMSAAFFGGVYAHSNAAHNVRAFICSRAWP
jgi:stearoyl-CoA desaturase (Delta-9 desaturase)